MLKFMKNHNSGSLNVLKWQILHFKNPWNWFHVKSEWHKISVIFTLCTVLQKWLHSIVNSFLLFQECIKYLYSDPNIKSLKFCFWYIMLNFEDLKLKMAYFCSNSISYLILKWLVRFGTLYQLYEWWKSSSINLTKQFAIWN